MKHTLYALLALTLTACNAQQRARTWGGTTEVQVQPGHKVIGATWKETDLWILTRPMQAGETPETVTLQESSAWGMVEGAVILQEQAPAPAKK